MAEAAGAAALNAAPQDGLTVGSIKRVLEVERTDLLAVETAADRLGVSLNRVRWLILNGRLQRCSTADRSLGGVTTESVEREQAWRAQATASQRLRRVLGYIFFWMP
jgi:hypothetical protein